MDRIALISDTHGNMPALEAVLEDIKSRGIGRIICLGDLAGKGPSSEAVVDLVKKKCEIVLKGNWDYLISEVNNRYFLQWHHDKLREDQIQFLKELPIYAEFYVSGKLIRLCHASATDVFRRIRLSSTREDKLTLFAAPNDKAKDCDMFIYGDLHGAFEENFSGKTLVNVGSVGNPLEITQASYGIIEGKYGGKEKSVISISLVRVPYDIEKAVDQALNSDMPDINEYINELRTGKYRGVKQ